MQIIYISHGNIPSKFANTFQAMKMAEALAGQVDQLTLVTAGGVLKSVGEPLDLNAWYGVSRGFATVRLPVFVRAPRFMPTGINRRFLKAAALYAKVKSAQLVYTRSRRAARYCTSIGLKTILETHSAAETMQDELKQAMSRRNLLGLVTVAEYLKEQYAAIGFPEEKIFVSPDAVDLERFSKLPPKHAIREQLGLPPNRPLVVYCGHFYEKKGVPCLIEAARRISEIDFCLVGGWPHDIHQMKRRACKAKNITFSGFVTNSKVPFFLAAADVLVLPNSAKTDHAKATSPLKLFEYMAAQRPVVATQIPALDGLLHDRKNCFLVKPDSPGDLVEGILAAFAEPVLAHRVAQQAFQEVQAYTWSHRAASILRHFGFHTKDPNSASYQGARAA